MWTRDQYFQSATYEYKNRRYEIAAKYYSAGLRIDPRSVVGYLDLGKCYEMLGRWSESVKALEKALRLSPGHPIALRRYTRVKAEQRFYENFQPELPKLLSQFCPPFRIPDVSDDVFLHVPAELPVEMDELSPLVAFNTTEINSLFRYSHIDQVPVDLLLLPSSPSLALKNTDDDSFLPSWAIGKYQNRQIYIRYDPQNRLMKTLFSIVLRHEWVHFVIDQLSGGKCPNWLDEGLAALISRPLMDSEKFGLMKNQEESDFAMPNKTLSALFSDIGGKIFLDYLQARLFVEWLIGEVSWYPILDYVRKMKDEVEPSVAFQETVGDDADEFYHRFQKQSIYQKLDWDNQSDE